jgi:tRNA dimethylallyltransferase
MMPGLLAETRTLMQRGFRRFLNSSRAIGYAEAMACLDGVLSEQEAAAGTVRRTKALARRQMAWLRRDPRIRWFPAGEDGAAGKVEELLGFLGRQAVEV